jgi:hypothetical protein
MLRLRSFLPRPAGRDRDVVDDIRRSLDQCIVLAGSNLVLTLAVLAKAYERDQAVSRMMGTPG